MAALRGGGRASWSASPTGGRSTSGRATTGPRLPHPEEALVRWAGPGVPDQGLHQIDGGAAEEGNRGEWSRRGRRVRRAQPFPSDAGLWTDLFAMAPRASHVRRPSARLSSRRWSATLRSSSWAWASTIPGHLRHDQGPGEVRERPGLRHAASEDRMTGVAIGAALAGLKPVHVTSAWISCSWPPTGRQHGGQGALHGTGRSRSHRHPGRHRPCWGQGPQHSQTCTRSSCTTRGSRWSRPRRRTTPGHLIQAIATGTPSWWWSTGCTCLRARSRGRTRCRSAGRTIAEGGDITIIGVSHMTVESLRAPTSRQGHPPRSSAASP